MPERQTRPHQTSTRQGPRPLPLHLMAHASILTGSRAALPLLKNGSLSWKPSLATEAEAIRKSLDEAGPNAWTELDRAVAMEGMARHQTMLAGIEAYRRHPWHRDLPAVPVIWRQGTTRLHDYRDPERPGGQPALVIPSLVNRAYILDLTTRRSLMRDLARRGLAPFLVDWDAPGPQERHFTLTDYIRRLSDALTEVHRLTSRPVALVGYCMGGNLALALAQHRPDLSACLALLATPWDFHAGRPGHGALLKALADSLGRMIDAAGCMPVDMLQAMFASLDPNLTARKFAAFSHLKTRSARARDFVALEDWANDGVALSAPVARECLFGWYADNATEKGEWRVDGRPVDPSSLRLPVLSIVPEHDRIVPPDSSRPLAGIIPGAMQMTARGGHVGMLLSRGAKTGFYAPLAKWLVRASAL